MKLRRIGRTPVEVTEISFGTTGTGKPSSLARNLPLLDAQIGAAAWVQFDAHALRP